MLSLTLTDETDRKVLLSPYALRTEWKISYKREIIMQVSLADAAAALRSTAFFMANHWQLICGALLLLALLPYTFLE